MTSQATRRATRRRSTCRPSSWSHTPSSGAGTPRGFATHGSNPMPNASNIPNPASVVALPPIPRITSVALDRATCSRRSPTPADVAPTGSRSAGSTLERPDASAISMTARVPSTERSQRARIRRPSGSVTSLVCHCQPPAASIAARVPSPPSARGHSRISSSGRARRQPSARARATSTEVNEPLKESGAMRIVRLLSMSVRHWEWRSRHESLVDGRPDCMLGTRPRLFVIATPLGVAWCPGRPAWADWHWPCGSCGSCGRDRGDRPWRHQQWRLRHGSLVDGHPGCMLGTRPRLFVIATPLGVAWCPGRPAWADWHWPCGSCGERQTGSDRIDRGHRRSFQK